MSFLQSLDLFFDLTFRDSRYFSYMIIIWLRQKSSLDADFLSSISHVSSEHPDLDISLSKVLDATLYVILKFIKDTSTAKQLQVSFKLFWK